MNPDLVIIGAGAAGLMCALTAGYAGKRVLVLDHAKRPGSKILMSGGGRCNFTNLACGPGNFFSANPAFCISALKRYRPEHFVELVERHGLEYVEKAPGQLFCADSAKELLAVLLTECEWAGVELRLNTRVERVERQGEGMRLQTPLGRIDAGVVVIATGGLSIPTMGATGFGYDVARQFGLAVTETRPALVPFTLTSQWKERAAGLAGVACDIAVGAVRDGQRHGPGRERWYREPMLFTHRGLSGPGCCKFPAIGSQGMSSKLICCLGWICLLCLPKRVRPRRVVNFRPGLPSACPSAWPRRWLSGMVKILHWRSSPMHVLRHGRSGLEHGDSSPPVPKAGVLQK